MKTHNHFCLGMTSISKWLCQGYGHTICVSVFLVIASGIIGGRQAAGQGLRNLWLLNGTFPFPAVTIPHSAVDLSPGGPTFFSYPGNKVCDISQANISDSNGNLLMFSNGSWLANRDGMVMPNGGNLTPTFCTADGHMGPYNSVILPWPANPAKYILFHMSCDGVMYNKPATLFYSIIDMNLDGGRGDVIQKNVVVLTDTIGVNIGACRHANGRDWWIVIPGKNSNVIYSLLLTPWGISKLTRQEFREQVTDVMHIQIEFSPDGSRMAYITNCQSLSNPCPHIRLFDFDRCTGVISNHTKIDINYAGWWGAGVSFSPNSRYLYAANNVNIYQVDCRAPDPAKSMQIVASFDGYINPHTLAPTHFYMLYRANDGRVYINSGPQTFEFSYIEFPDSAGPACSVKQHALTLPCSNYRAVPHHPNYYLGPEHGSFCDSLGLGMAETGHFIGAAVFPNPSSGNGFTVSYSLPRGMPGTLELKDISGRKVHEQVLPTWSTVQAIRPATPLPAGIYLCIIHSGPARQTLKLIVNGF
jgi:hypothetical protein